MNDKKWQPIFALGLILFLMGATWQSITLFSTVWGYGPLALGIVFMASGLSGRASTLPK